MSATLVTRAERAVADAQADVDTLLKVIKILNRTWIGCAIVAAIFLVLSFAATGLLGLLVALFLVLGIIAFIVHLVLVVDVLSDEQTALRRAKDSLADAVEADRLEQERFEATKLRKA